MSEILIKAGQLLLSLSILVVLHELGHFIPAKLFKTKVERFYLFFNPWFSLFKIKKGETEYGIGWLPLGGYVKIAGMVDESMDTKNLNEEPEPWEFRAKPAWQRLIIMIGGVTVNLFLGFIIFSMVVFVWGDEQPVVNEKGMYIHPLLQQNGVHTGDVILEVDGKEARTTGWINEEILFFGGRDLLIQDANGVQRNVILPEDIDYQAIEAGAKKGFSLVDFPLPFIVDSLMPNMPAKKAGLEVGDSIVAVNGVQPAYFQDLRYAVAVSNDPVNIRFKRNDEVMELSITPELDPESGNVLIGVVPAGPLGRWYEIEKREYGLGESIKIGVSDAMRKLGGNVISMKFLFTEAGISQVGGFISIGKLFPGQWNWRAFWFLTGFLSLILAFMNILPIPALDGGHVLFTLYEMVAGKAPPKKFMESAQMVGMIILLSLLLLVNGKDIIENLPK